MRITPNTQDNRLAKRVSGRTFRFVLEMTNLVHELDLNQLDPNGDLADDAPEKEVLDYVAAVIHDDYGSDLWEWVGDWEMVPVLVSVDVQEVTKEAT